MRAMGEFPPWPEKWKESEEENAEPTEPVQLALTGGGHTAEGKVPKREPVTRKMHVVIIVVSTKSKK